jgi:hypothetical protein
MNFNQGKNKNQHIGGLKPHPTVKYILTRDIFEKSVLFFKAIWKSEDMIVKA